MKVLWKFAFLRLLGESRSALLLRGWRLASRQC